MTKREYIENQRLQPLGDDGIEELRGIVSNRHAHKINEVLIDLYSASVMLSIYDNLTEGNKDVFKKLTVGKAAQVSFRLAVKCGAKNAA